MSSVSRQIAEISHKSPRDCQSNLKVPFKMSSASRTAYFRPSLDFNFRVKKSRDETVIWQKERTKERGGKRKTKQSLRLIGRDAGTRADVVAASIARGVNRRSQNASRGGRGGGGVEQGMANGGEKRDRGVAR